MPLQFGISKEINWKILLKRIDTAKGYIKNNVCFICMEFNSIVNLKKTTENLSGCNRNKVQDFITKMRINKMTK